LLEIYLSYDRDATLEQLRRVINTFKMPAVHLLADSRKRMGDVLDLEIFNESLFVTEVYQPVIQKMGIQRHELRRKKPREQLVMQAGVNMKP
jgi:hypothetical protein